MGRRAARNLHLALWLLGLVLYVVFVIPRWWVLTGDIPAPLATMGRIAAGLPVAAAAVPVGLLLRGAMTAPGGDAAVPEIALRLRAWSGVLHVVAGVLIVLTAIAEIWLHSPAIALWLYALYGAAGSIAVLAALAFALSFYAEKPPGEPKPAKAKPAKVNTAKKIRLPKRKTATAVAEAPETAETSEEEVSEESEEEAPAEPAEESGGLRNKRPTGKSRLRS